VGKKDIQLTAILVLNGEAVPLLQELVIARSAATLAMTFSPRAGRPPPAGVQLAIQIWKRPPRAKWTLLYQHLLAQRENVPFLQS
jgi:hypothetical protein